MKNIEKKNVVITGATSGIGKATAIEFAKHGCNLILVGTQEEKLKKNAEEISSEYGVKALYRKVDITNKDEVFALADYAYDQLGSVEILMNNAGVALRPSRAHWDTKIEEYEWVLAANLWGVIYGHLAFVPRMLETPGEKHIVNTSSMASMYDIAGVAAYSTSKAAVDGFSNSAREELKHFNIGVSVFHPGTVRTPIGGIQRLMKDELREKQADVKPWAEYVGSANAGGAAILSAVAPEEDPDLPVDPYRYITTKYVGQFVIEGILKNKPHIMTHPLPMPQILARFNGIFNAVPDYSAVRDE